MTQRISISCTVAFCLIQVGCAGEVLDDTVTTDKYLSAYNDWSRSLYWNPHESVHVCFTGPYTTTSRINAFFDALNENKWGSLSLVNEGLCPSSPASSWVVVYVDDPSDPKLSSAGATARKQKGRKFPVPYIRELQNERCTITTLFSYSTCVSNQQSDCDEIPHYDEGVCTGDAADDFERRTDVDIWMHGGSNGTMVHEFGHKLGAPHEHLRPEGDGCDESAAVFELTEYDPDSAMHYCRSSNSSSLSRLDELGFEILYPFSSIELVCREGCFEADGDLILRSNGTIQDEWTRRGALTWWQDDGNHDPQWYRGAALLTENATLHASLLPAGVSSLEMIADAALTEDQIEGTVTVEKSDARWTGIAISVL